MCLLGRRRGFIKTIIGLVGTLAAVVLASAFGPAAASVIRTRMVGPFFERTVGDYLMTYMSGVGESAEAFAEQFNQLLAEMPEVLEAYLRRFSVSPEEVRQSLSPRRPSNRPARPPSRPSARPCRRR